MNGGDANRAPPANTPWLVSSAAEIQASLKRTAKWRHEWMCSYPGVKSTHCEKNLWARRIEREANQLQNLLPFGSQSNGGNDTRPHEASVTLRQILYQTNTDQLMVQLIAARSVLEELGMKYSISTDIYSSTISPQAEREHTHKPPDFALLATVIRRKDARTQDVIDNLLQSVGLSVSSYVRCAPARGGLQAEADINFHLPEFLGETLSFYAHTNAPHPVGISVVAFEVLRKGDPESPIEYQSRLHARNYASFRLGCMFVRRNPAKYNINPNGIGNKNGNSALHLYQVTEHTHDVLWFREEQEVTRVRRHLRWGDGETEDVKRRLDKDGEDCAGLRLAMIVREFEYMKTLDSGNSIWARKLSSLLAITLEIVNDTKFIREAPVSNVDAVLSTLKAIAGFWRTILKTISPVDLGLGTPNQPGTAKASFDALLALLKSVKEELESIQVQVQLPAPAQVNGNDEEKQEEAGNGGSSSANMSMVAVKFACLPRKATTSKRKAGGDGEKSKRKTGEKTKRAPRAPSDGTLGAPKPLGRVPTDSMGEKMVWDGTEGSGLWRSVSVKSETKTPSKKKRIKSGGDAK